MKGTWRTCCGCVLGAPAGGSQIKVTYASICSSVGKNRKCLASSSLTRFRRQNSNSFAFGSSHSLRKRVSTCFRGSGCFGSVDVGICCKILASKFSNSGVVGVLHVSDAIWERSPAASFRSRSFVPLVSAKGVFSGMGRRSTMLTHKAVLFSEPIVHHLIRFCVDDEMGFQKEGEEEIEGKKEERIK